MGLFILTAPPVDAAANISIMHPMEDHVVYGDEMDLNLSISDFTLNASAIGGPNVAGEGHWHLYINGNLIAPYATENLHLAQLPQGDHLIEVELVENDHSSLSPKVMASVNITVMYPEIMIESPYDGAILYGGMMDLHAMVKNFTLTDDYGMENVNGEGHWHVYINDVLDAPYSGSWANYTGLPAGDHEIKVDLRNNDHTAISPVSEDTIGITVVEEMPTIAVPNLPMDAVGYGGMLNMHVDVQNFDLVDKFGESNVAGEGHYHLYINDNLIGPYTSDWLNLTDLPAGDHVFKLELVNNDHSSIMPMTYYMFNVKIFSEVPEIMITHPMEMSLVYSDSLDVHVMVENFTMNASAIGGEPAPMEGHYHIYINDGLVGPYTDMMVTLNDLPVGEHVLKVELVNNDHTALNTPVMDMVHFRILDDRPMIMLKSPMDGQINYNDDLDVEVMIYNFTMNASAIGMDNMPGEGHYHIYINDVLVGPYTDMMVYLEDLPAGDHMMKVELVNNDHSSLVPPVYDMAEFTIVDSVPTIEIVSPMDDTILYKDSLDLEVSITGLEMNASAIGGDNMVGEGHYHIYINDALVGPYTETMVTLNDLPAGDHMLKVQLVNNDHSAVIPEVMDMIEFTIADSDPSIMIESPMDGAIIYDDKLDLMVNVSDFMLNGTSIGLTNVAGQGHYHIYINDNLVGPFYNMSVMLEDLPAGDHVLKVELRNNDHSALMGEMDMFMDMVHFTISDLRPQIHIMHPMDMAILYQDSLDLHVEIMNFTMNETAVGGNNSVGEGHYHVYINDALVGPFTNMSVMLEDLPAGDHVLKVALRNNDHSMIYGHMDHLMDMVHFTIVDQMPSIEIVKPMEGAKFFGGDLHIEVMIEDLMMNASAIGGSNSAGEGHWHLYINGDLIGPYTDMMVDLTDLPAGMHELKVELRNNDHSLLMPVAMDMVMFQLLPMPMIEIISPSNGTTLDGSTLDLEVEVTNFMLNATAVGGANMMGEGHYHIYINDDLVGPYTNLSVMLEDLPAGDHVLKVMLVNNDHSELGIEAMDMIYFTVPEMETDITLSFGPVLMDDEPVEGATVKLMLGDEMFTAMTDSMGNAEFTVPMDWKGQDIEYEINKDGYETLKGTASVDDSGDLQIAGDISLEEEEDEDLMPVILLVILIVIILIVVAFFFMRSKGEEMPEE